MNYIEIVDNQGVSLSDGTAGNVIVTFFENYVTPFIRYQLGDQGFLHKEKCRCGRGSGVITLEGREPIIIAIDGVGSIPLIKLTNYIAKNYASGIMQYQFILKDASTLLLKYVSTNIIRKPDQLKIKEYFEKLVQGRIKIEIAEVSEILPESSGKTPVFIRR